MTKQKRELLIKAIGWMLVLGSLLINLKNVLTSCHVDSEYQVTMAYRILRGDAMFSEMWESHQTSAFFLAFFEWIFIKITGSTTGIVLYANAVGLCCKVAVAGVVYATLRKRVFAGAAFATLIFLLNTYPKDMVLPEFSNLQIWFALLLICCLIVYLEGAAKGEGKLPLLFAAAGCLCMEVLAYPSCAVVWLACVCLLGKYSAKKKRDILLFTGICLVAGVSYLLVFMRGNPAQFMEYIYQIWSGDESHAVGLDVRLSLIGRDVIALAGDMIYILAMAVVALLFVLLGKALVGKKYSFFTADGMRQIWFALFVGIYIAVYLLFLPGEQAGTKHHFFILFLVVEGMALYRARYLGEAEKRIHTIGQFVGWGGFVATLFLSDMGIFPTLLYLIPNLSVGMIPLTKPRPEGKAAEENSGMKRIAAVNFLAVALFCGIMIFRNFIYINGWMYVPSNFKEDSIFGVTWTAQYGPLKGIVNRDGTYEADVTYGECRELLRPGDRVLVLSYPTLPSTLYLYEDVEICVDSTISTPTYSERLMDYWEENPEKYPNVVIAKCYGENMMIGGDTPVYRWLTEEFQADRVVDGTFWRYYIKDRDN